MKAITAALITAALFTAPAMAAKCVNILGESCDAGTKTEAPAPTKEHQIEGQAPTSPLDTVDGVIGTLNRVDQQGQEIKRLFNR